MLAQRVVLSRRLHAGVQRAAAPLLTTAPHYLSTTPLATHTSSCFQSAQLKRASPEQRESLKADTHCSLRHEESQEKTSPTGTQLITDSSSVDLTGNYISQVRWRLGGNPSTYISSSSSAGSCTHQCASDTNQPQLTSSNVNSVHSDNVLNQYLDINSTNSLRTLHPGMLGISGLSPRFKLLYNWKIPLNVAQKTLSEKHNAGKALHKCNEPFQHFLTDSVVREIYGGHSGSTVTRRFYHTTASLFDPEPSSQVEVTVNDLKEKAEASKQDKEKTQAAAAAAAAATSPKSQDVFATTTKVTDTVTKKSSSIDATPPAASSVGGVIADTQRDADKASATQASTTSVSPVPATALEEKKSMWLRFKEEVAHYYHGFRLLFIDTKICIKYGYRVINGEKLSRREYRQMVRTTGDLFRLVPFSVFIIVPFMELLLPVAIKLFPGMLPSTFETANEKEAKIKKRLKVKLEMAKFLQETLDSMSLQSKGHKSKSAKEFVLFFEKVRRTGEQVTNEEILKFSKLFADSITLDSLSRPQLTAICRLLEMQPFGTNNFLRFQIRMKLRSLVADDKLIRVEGVESMSSWELQQACRSRGMRAYGMTDARLASQLKQWLELSLDKKVPPSLLLLSRTLYLSDTVDPNQTLVATISQLPDEVKTRAKAAIGKREGKIDNLTRLEVIQSEEKRIQEDKKDMEDDKKKRLLDEAKKRGELGIGVAEVVSVGGPSSPASLHSPLSVDAPPHPPTAEAVVAQAVKVTRATVTPSGEIKQADKDELVDRAPVLEDKAPLLSTETAPAAAAAGSAAAEAAAAGSAAAADKKKPVEESDELSSEDLAEVEEALETIGAKQRRMIIEEQELTELKEEMQDYEQDIQDFKNVIEDMPERADLRESKAARRLFVKINRLIAQAEPVIGALSDTTQQMQRVVDAGEADKQHRDTLVNLEDLTTHLRQVADAPDSAKVAVIRDVLTAMDTDNDGAIKLEHLLKALELLSEDQVGVPRKLFEEVVQAMTKEEQLETKTVVQKAIKASKPATTATSSLGGDSGGRVGESAVDEQKQQ